MACVGMKFSNFGYERFWFERGQGVFKETFTKVFFPFLYIASEPFWRIALKKNERMLFCFKRTHFNVKNNKKYVINRNFLVEFNNVGRFVSYLVFSPYGKNHIQSSAVQAELMHMQRLLEHNWYVFTRALKSFLVCFAY